jgi:hypothetical protein
MQHRLKLITLALVTSLGMAFSNAHADEGRYQAYWTGKYFMILDSDDGNIWSYFGDQIMYNGRIDGEDFQSPEKTKIWNLSHGKWVRQ